jgi:hypothetical protein
MARRLQARGAMAHPSSFVPGSPPLAVLIPAFAGLVVLGLLIGVITGDAAEPSGSKTDAHVSASPTVVVAGAPNGKSWPLVLTAPSATATPSMAASASPTPTAEPTKQPKHEDGFSADVMICKSVRGSHCQGSTDTIDGHVGTIWIMVAFENSKGGDRIGMELSGPGGTRDGGAYRVNGGDGRAWSRVAGKLEPGDYTLVATRNGEVVAEETVTVR